MQKTPFSPTICSNLCWYQHDEYLGHLFVIVIVKAMPNHCHTPGKHGYDEVNWTLLTSSGPGGLLKSTIVFSPDDSDECLCEGKKFTSLSWTKDDGLSYSCE